MVHIADPTWLRNDVDETGDGLFDRGERYVYDELAKTDPATGIPLYDLAMVFAADGSLESRFLNGPAIGQVFADQQALDEIFWALDDHQGTTRAVIAHDEVTNTTSAVTSRTLDSFGNITAETNPVVISLTIYAGLLYDSDAEAYIAAMRLYDPLTGRWLSKDPAQSGTNFDIYAENNAPNAVDPSGFDPWPVLTGPNIGGTVNFLEGFVQSITGEPFEEQPSVRLAPMQSPPPGMTWEEVHEVGRQFPPSPYNNNFHFEDWIRGRQAAIIVDDNVWRLTSEQEDLLVEGFCVNRNIFRDISNILPTGVLTGRNGKQALERVEAEVRRARALRQIEEWNRSREILDISPQRIADMRRQTRIPLMLDDLDQFGRIADLAGGGGAVGRRVIQRTVRSGIPNRLWYDELGSILGPGQNAPHLPGIVDPAHAACSSADDGIIYLRLDGKGGEYVGQAESQNRNLKRQIEHAEDYPLESFVFEELERVPLGSSRSLDVAEEDWIRAGGGPQSTGGRLQNSRHQMSEHRYRADGGTIGYP